MVRKNLLRSVSVIMACMMAVLTVACGSNTAATENGQATAVVETAQEQQLEKSLANSASALGAIGEAGKVETVYVTADANGAVNDVIVSEWLKNAEQSAELSDTTELHDIVNVKGSETFTENGDGTVTWDAAGSDIYYQGTTDKELPVDMKITYTLDGKEITPSELAGKSGKVTIRFEYENKSKQTVNVDGKDIEVYTPFAMVSGMMLDSDKFSNVEISNGKVISEGNNYVVMGVALPGLKESLDISDEKWDELEDSEEIKGKLSNSFEITADTTDFELGMTITMASSDILSDFGATDIADSSKIDDLKDDMGELNDGSTKLVEGAGTLKDGTGKLAEGSKELKDGTGKLYDGTKELKDGTGKLSDGTGKLANGAGQLSDGAGTLANGTSTLKGGTGKLADGSKTLSDGISSYTSGVSQVNAGAKQLKAGTGALKEGAGKVSAGLDQLSYGAKTLSTGTDQLIAGAGQLSAMTNGVETLLKNKYAMEKAVAYLDGKAPLDDSILETLKTLSGGKISDTTTAETAKAYGLKIRSAETSGVVKQEENNSEADEVEATGGVVMSASSESSEEKTNEPVVDEQADEKNTEEAAANVPDTTGTGEKTQTGDVTVIEEEKAPLSVSANASQNSTSDSSANEVVTSSENEQNGLGSLDDLDPEIKKLVEEEITRQVSAQLESVKNQTAAAVSAQYEAAIKEKTEAATKEANETVRYAALYFTVYGAANGALTTIDTTLGKLGILPTEDEIRNGITAEMKAEALSKKLAAFGKGLRDIKTGIDGGTLSDGTPTAGIQGGVTQLKAGMVGYTGENGNHVAGLCDGLNQVDAGVGELVKGTDTLVANNDKLNSGAKQVSDGAAQLDTGATQLKDGADKLATGAKELKSGADELNTGAGTLDNGATELMNGAKDLDDGAGKLDEGIGKVDDGVQELLDGITKLDQEGIKKLYEAFDGDLTDFVDKLTAIKEAGTEYTSFAGASDEEDCSVKFIIRTAGVKAEDI